MRIALIGAGNLATQLGIVLVENGHNILQVYSRTEKNAKDLAAKLNCPFTNGLSGIVTEADLFIIAVADNAIESILTKVNFDNNLVVHTAGGISMDIFSPYCKSYGVFYPIQTFSKERAVDFNEIPVCLEANTLENIEILKNIAGSISEKVQVINSEERFQIHLAAVFACNFVNHLYSISEKLLGNKEIDFDLLKPLIMETASKAVAYSPGSVQTGPALRNDTKVMNKHLEMLSNHPEWAKLYQLISENIYNIHKQ